MTAISAEATSFFHTFIPQNLKCTEATICRHCTKAAVFLHCFHNDLLKHGGTAAHCEDTNEQGKSFLQRQMLHHPLRSDDLSDLVANQSVIISLSMHDLHYIYQIHSIDNLPEIVGDLNSSGLYVCYSLPIQSIVPGCTSLSTSQAPPQSNTVYNASYKEVVMEVNDKVGQGIKLRCFTYLDYKQMEVWVLIS